MRLRPIAGLFAACLLFSSSAAFAWNNIGHETVAAIAWDQLSTETKAKVVALLKQHPDYERTFLTRATEEFNAPAGNQRDRATLAVAATWPDLIRSPSFGSSYKYAHSTWHYADTPYIVGDFKGKAEEPESDWKPGVEPKNALQAYKKITAELQDQSLPAETRAVDLCWLVHITGDIHQPLHAVSMYSNTYPTGDRGGNSQNVKDGDRGTNLHSLWDSALGYNLSYSAVELVASKLETTYPPASYKEKATDLNFSDWMQESYDLAKKNVYLEGRLSTSDKKGAGAPELPTGYDQQMQGVAAKQAALAGYRLGAEITDIFSKYPAPAGSTSTTKP